MRILLPDLLRRVAALTVISALGIALLAPLTTHSALPQASEVDHLLDQADRLSTIDRSSLQGRERSAALALIERSRHISTETLGIASALPTPGSAPMEATLYLKPTPRPAPRVVATVAPPPGGSTVTGKATWYCCTAGYRGQAVVALPGALGGRYDPPPASRTVTVCAERCVELPVVDYCGCYWGTANQRVADLSPEAWAAVSDAGLGAGVIRVTVHL